MPEKSWPNVTVIRHPIVQQALSEARDRRTPVDAFRLLVGRISRLMAYEITRDLATRGFEVETPLARCEGARIARGVSLIPILRAGLGMVDGILDILPTARVGHLGIYREESTLRPITYYNKLPPDIADTDVIVIDPMLATAGSLIAAIDAIKLTGATNLRVLSLVAAPEGLNAVHARHPETLVYVAAIDEHLNDRGFIVPGLGDAGDRIFGTA